MLKGTKGLETNSPGLKGFRKLFVVLSDGHFYSLVCTCIAFCCGTLSIISYSIYWCDTRDTVSKKGNYIYFNYNVLNYITELSICTLKKSFL